MLKLSPADKAMRAELSRDLARSHRLIWESQQKGGHARSLVIARNRISRLLERLS